MRTLHTFASYAVDRNHNESFLQGPGMTHPDEVVTRIKKLAGESDGTSDTHLLAAYCLELEQGLIKPLRQQIIALERRVHALEAEALRAREKII